MTADKQRVTDLELKALEEWLLNVNTGRPAPETREALLRVIDEVRDLRAWHADVVGTQEQLDDMARQQEIVRSTLRELLR